MSEHTSSTVPAQGRLAAPRPLMGAQSRWARLGRAVWRHRWLYVLMTPALIYFALFKYLPLWNAQIAFRDFKPTLGVEGSPFVGLKHFATFVSSYYFTQLIGNTLFFSIAKLILGIPLSIALAVALSETRFALIRRMVQTASYLPHFLSWVIVYGILLMMLSPGHGLINEVIKALGGRPIAFLTSPDWFRGVVIFSDIWKETGWSTIIYLAALLSIDPTLYEVATIDGASRMQRIRHISLPGILDVVVIITLLRLGTILDAGFGQIFVLYSLPVYSVGDILDTWVYRQGILQFQFSLATAVGLFKGLIGLGMILASNRIARRIAGTSLY